MSCACLYSWVRGMTVVVAFFVVLGRLWGSSLSKGIGSSDSGGFFSCFVIGFVVMAILSLRWLWWCDLMVDSTVGGFKWFFFFCFFWVLMWFLMRWFWCLWWWVVRWWTVVIGEVGCGAVDFFNVILIFVYIILMYRIEK